jgi:hypothetical protein
LAKRVEESRPYALDVEPPKLVPPPKPSALDSILAGSTSVQGYTKAQLLEFLASVTDQKPRRLKSQLLEQIQELAQEQ